jgi:Heterokaryon incompatibility protein (HET)
MPKTFKDAVIATREIGFRYLWIDSLYIVQDSSEDWDRECSTMASIYRNSSATMCGSKVSNSSSGFLHPRTCADTPPYLWEYKTSEDTSYKRATISRRNAGNYPRYESLTQEERRSPLRQRGWIFQEYLLSPRLPYFGLYRMYWECSMCVQIEDFQFSDKLSDKNPWPLRHSCGLHCLIAKSDNSPFERVSSANLTNAWHKVIQDYTRRSLSESSDKLPAISGVANWLFSGQGNGYLAGIHKTALHEELAWGIYLENADTDELQWLRPGTGTSKHLVDVQKHPVPPYRASSWSWASTNYPVYFTTLRSPRMLQSGTDVEDTKGDMLSCQNKIESKYIILVSIYRVVVHSGE